MSSSKRDDRSAPKILPTTAIVATDEDLARRRALGIETLAEGEELIDVDTFARMHARLIEKDADPQHDELLLVDLVTELPSERETAGAVAKTVGPPKDAEDMLALEIELGLAKSRADVVRIALRLARHQVAAAALFVVNRGMIAGLAGDGGDLATRIDGIAVPASGDGVLAHVVEHGKACLSSGAGDDMLLRVLRALGRAEVAEVAVFPILIGARVVNVLYVDNGPNPLPNTGKAAIAALTRCVSNAYERLIRDGKDGTPRSPSAR
jgi:hypothetical protein